MKFEGQTVCGGPAHFAKPVAQKGIQKQAKRSAAYHQHQPVQEQGQRNLKAIGADGLAYSLIAAAIERPH